MAKDYFHVHVPLSVVFLIQCSSFLINFISLAKRGKKEKIGTMSNVMSDLLRHKYLDDLESKAKKDEANPGAKPK